MDQHWAIYNNGNLAKSITISQDVLKICQILFKDFKNCPKRAEFCQSGEISPNLITVAFTQTILGQWLCGSVGRAVASDTSGPRFASSHRQKIVEHLFTVNCVLKRRK